MLRRGVGNKAGAVTSSTRVPAYIQLHTIIFTTEHIFGESVYYSHLELFTIDSC